MGRTLLACCLVLWVSGLIYAAAPAFTDGQQVEVREGDSWSGATIVRKEGRKYLIHYEGTEASSDEWVAVERLRAPGDQTNVATAAAVPKVPAAPQAAQFSVGQKVEVKWGGTWREAQILRKQGAWTLVAYDRGAFREWVEPWRIRKGGSKEDNIGHATPNETMLKSMPIKPPPREKPEAAPEPQGSQEKADRAESFENDPTYKEADLTGAEKLQLLSQAGGWELSPDPAPQASGAPSSRAVALKGATDKFWDSPKAVVISRDGKLGLVGHVNAEPGHAGDTRIERINVPAATSMGLFTATAGTIPVDVAPDGSAMLLRSDEFGIGIGKKDRLEVWTLADMPKRTLMFFPYASSQWHERDAETAMFVDAGHVLTVSRKGVLVLWDLSTCKAAYTCDVAAETRPALSAGGKYLAIETGKFIFILEPTSGKVLAEIPYEVGGMRGSALAFSPSGKTLAAFSDKFVQFWDMASGKPRGEFTLSVGGSSMAMLSDDYLLIDDSILVDCQRRVALWKYEASKGSATVSAAGRLFYATRDEGRKLTVFGSCALPDSDASAQAAKLKPDEMLLLHPGVKVSISLNIEANDAMRRQIIDSLKKRLTDNGLVVTDEDQPVRVVASTETGKTVQREYHPFGAPFGQTQKVDVTELITRLAIEAEGKVAWENRTVSEAGFMMHLKEGQSMQDAANEASRPNYQMLKTARLPAYLAAPREPAWYGNSRLTGRGAVQEPLRSTTPGDPNAPKPPPSRGRDRSHQASATVESAAKVVLNLRTTSTSASFTQASNAKNGPMG